MVKKIMIMGVFLIVTSTARAELKLPPTHAGAYFSFKDKALNHAETFDVAKWKALNLELGYAGSADETDHKFVTALTVDIEQLKLKNYIQLPILDLMEFRPALFLGLGRINLRDISGAKIDYGIGASLITLKF